MLRLLIALLVALSLGPASAEPAARETADLFEQGRAKAASGDIQGALVIYQTLTEQQPDSAEAFAHLGGMQLLSQRYSDAVQSFQQAISLGDATARSFIGMGMAYLHLRQLALARAAFVEAQARGTKKPDDIANIIAWIDQQRAAAPGAHSP